MVFISLWDTVNGIANSAPAPRSTSEHGSANDAHVAEFWRSVTPHLMDVNRLSCAARTLNQFLHQHGKRPQWMRFDSGKEIYVYDEAIAEEGIRLLTHATGWYAREVAAHRAHIEEWALIDSAIATGTIQASDVSNAHDDPMKWPVSHKTGDAPTELMLSHVGFELADLCACLDLADPRIAHRFQLAAPALVVGAVVDDAPIQDASVPPQQVAEPTQPEPVPARGKLIAGALVHTTKQCRTSTLRAVINIAASRAIDATDWISVWDAFVVIAKDDNRPAPLLGYTEGEGVKYQTDKEQSPVAFLTREAFRKRFNRKT